jgi:hypothetical protein
MRADHSVQIHSNTDLVKNEYKQAFHVSFTAVDIDDAIQEQSKAKNQQKRSDALVGILKASRATVIANTGGGVAGTRLPTASSVVGNVDNAAPSSTKFDSRTVVPAEAALDSVVGTIDHQDDVIAEMVYRCVFTGERAEMGSTVCPFIPRAVKRTDAEIAVIERKEWLERQELMLAFATRPPRPFWLRPPRRLRPCPPSPPPRAPLSQPQQVRRRPRRRAQDIVGGSRPPGSHTDYIALPVPKK